MDLSIIIPHRGEQSQLWFTTTAMAAQLEGSGIDYEFRIVSNGERDPFLPFLINSLKDTGRLGYYEHVPTPLSPPAARQRGANGARGSVLNMGDNHILFGEKYFVRSMNHFAANPTLCKLSTAYKFHLHFTRYHYLILNELYGQSYQ